MTSRIDMEALIAYQDREYEPRFATVTHWDGRTLTTWVQDTRTGERRTRVLVTVVDHG